VLAARPRPELCAVDWPEPPGNPGRFTTLTSYGFASRELCACARTEGYVLRRYQAATVMALGNWWSTRFGDGDRERPTAAVFDADSLSVMTGWASSWWPCSLDGYDGDSRVRDRHHGGRVQPVTADLGGQLVTCLIVVFENAVTSGRWSRLVVVARCRRVRHDDSHRVGAEGGIGVGGCVTEPLDPSR